MNLGANRDMSKHKYGEESIEMMALTGLSVKPLNGYRKIYPAMMLHEVAEQALNNTNGSLKSCKITIPKVGIIRVSRTKGEGIKYTFVPDQDFEKQMVNAMDKGESPLTKILETSVVSMINQKYEDIF